MLLRVYIGSLYVVVVVVVFYTLIQEPNIGTCGERWNSISFGKKFFLFFMYWMLSFDLWIGWISRNFPSAFYCVVCVIYCWILQLVSRVFLNICFFVFRSGTQPSTVAVRAGGKETFPSVVRKSTPFFLLGITFRDRSPTVESAMDSRHGHF